MTAPTPQAATEALAAFRETLLRHAKNSPKTPALLCASGHSSLPFKKLPAFLEDRARRLLPAGGIAPGSHIYVRRVDHTWHSALDLLAAAWAGAVLLPLSSRWPRLRGQQFLRDFSPAGRNGFTWDADFSAWWPARGLLPGTLIATSGSTGQPKLAHHRWQAHWASAEGAHTRLPLKPGDAWWINLPLWHVSGLAALLRCLHSGATAILARPGTDPSEKSIPLITHVSLVPTQLKRALDTPAPHWLDGKLLLIGGARVPARLRAGALSRGWRIHVTYGLTEAASQVCTTPQLTAPEPETSGPPLPFRTVSASGSGELLIGGPVLMEGYWTRSHTASPQLSHPALETPFLHQNTQTLFPTGDLALWHDHPQPGWQILGRKDRRFTSAGENINPEKIEAVLLSLPGVTRAAVVPAPDPEYGARPAAFLQGPSDFQHLAELARLELTGLEIPAHWFPWPEHLPPADKPPLPLLQRLLAECLGTPFSESSPATK